MKIIWIILAALMAINIIPDETVGYTEVPVTEDPVEDTPIEDDICMMEIDYLGGDGHDLELASNTSAVDPTYDQMIEFIREDKTDRNEYIPDQYVCGDFAADVQHNAEVVGYNCAWVYIEFTDGTTHACNVFDTTDRGLVFVDCTRSMGDGPTNQDCIVNVVDGEEYTSKFIKSTDYTTQPMGIVESHEVIWYGDLW